MMARKMGAAPLFFVETAVKYEQFYSGQEHLSAFDKKVGHNFSLDILRAGILRIITNK